MMWPVFPIFTLAIAVLSDRQARSTPDRSPRSMVGLPAEEARRLLTWVAHARERQEAWIDTVERFGPELLEGDPQRVPAAALEAMLAHYRDWEATAWDPTYFASGSNRVGEISGFASVGQHVGVAAPECRGPCREALLRLAGSGVRVFIDSGAFSEVEFGPAGPRVVRPMADDDWQRIFDLYDAVAERLGPMVHVVAPDRVGDQQVTLQRMRQYGARVRHLRDLGARVLVPLQRGPIASAEFWLQAAIAMGLSPDDPGLIPAVPAKKNATTLPEFIAFLDAARPAAVHLLGMGPRSAQVEAFLAAARARGVRVYMDSVMITAHAGRTGGPGGGPRRLTAASDAAESRAFTSRPQASGALLGASGDPTMWMSAAVARRVGRQAGLDDAQLRAFTSDPTAALRTLPEPLYRAAMPLVVRAAEAHFVLDPTATQRKHEAVREAFGPDSDVSVVRPPVALPVTDRRPMVLEVTWTDAVRRYAMPWTTHAGVGDDGRWIPGYVPEATTWAAHPELATAVHSAIYDHGRGDGTVTVDGRDVAWRLVPEDESQRRWVRQLSAATR